MYGSLNRAGRCIGRARLPREVARVKNSFHSHLLALFAGPTFATVFPLTLRVGPVAVKRKGDIDPPGVVNKIQHEYYPAG
jgi:hypothetical protein